MKLFDTVALIQDCPERGLLKGQVGVVVENLGDDVFEVEFSDNQGVGYATGAFQADRLLPLLYQPTGSHRQ